MYILLPYMEVARVEIRIMFVNKELSTLCRNVEDVFKVFNKLANDSTSRFLFVF